MAKSSNQKKIALLREFSIPLILGVVAALVWVNISERSYHAALHHPLVGSLDLHFLTNDLFMVFFFGIAAVEITASVSPGGALHPMSRAINPLFATLGGVLGPVAVYLTLNYFFGTPSLLRGWGIPTATDIALAWLAARLTLGPRHPAVAFLLLLAVADDAIGLAIIAIFYPDPHHPVRPAFLLLVAVGMVVAFLLRKQKTQSYWPYLLLAGSAAWAGLFLSRLHPALALAFVVPFMPHRIYAADETAFDLQRDDPSTLARFEHDWKLIVDFGLFFFGLANAGVPLTGVGAATWLVLAALIVGKTGGIFAMALLGQSLGFPLADGIDRRSLFLVSLIASIGLTVALFVAGEAFSDPAIQGAAKMGALLSAFIGPAAYLLSKIRPPFSPSTT